MRLVVTSHEVQHNHPLYAMAHESHPTVRRLTEEEVDQSSDLLAYNASNSDIKDYASDRFGKQLSTANVAYLRKKVKGVYKSLLLFCIIIVLARTNCFS
jgi:hypothetical protein